MQLLISLWENSSRINISVIFATHLFWPYPDAGLVYLHSCIGQRRHVLNDAKRLQANLLRFADR